MEPKKIIVIEDDVALAEIYAVKLRAGGQNNVLVAHDGDAGLTMIQNEKPDLVISDIMMPKMSGFDMLDILRSNPDTANIKVILMTALSGDAEKTRGEQLKADKYFVKSGATIDDLVAAAFELLAGGATAVMHLVDPAAVTSSASMPVAPAPATTADALIGAPAPSVFADATPATNAAPVAPEATPEPTAPPAQPTPSQGIFSAPQ